MTKCTNCGSESWDVVDRLGAIETWRCQSCGYEETMHVYDPRLNPVLPVDLAPVFTLVARWSAKPTARQIVELQRLFPRLQALSSIDLMKKARDGSGFELGRFTESELPVPSNQLAQLGVDVERVPVGAH